VRITRVEPIVLRLPSVDVTRADGTQDALLVRLHTDEGLVGIGEADSSPYLVKTAIDMPSSHLISRGIAEVLVGEDPLQIDRLWQLMYQGSSYYGRGGVASHAISAIDIALWDLAGKALGVPVSELLGGRRVDRMPVYASAVMPESPEEVAALASQTVADGYDAFKVGWGPLGQDLGRDAELIGAAREALGPGRRLMIDGGQAYTVKSVGRLLERVADQDLFWFEEPFRPDDLDSYRRLSACTDVRIAAGEVESGRAAFARLIDAARLDVLQPDLARCGGFTVGRQIRDLCRGGGPMIIPHCFSSGVLVAASLQFAAALDEPVLSEYSIADSPLVNELLEVPFTLEDGSLAVRSQPGLGVALNEDVVARLRAGSTA
jgi:L-alanine-DL-glutamate epimerase-like enolase superfamily enzyme